MAAKPKDVDWEAVRKAYSAGIRTLRDISQEFGVSHVAIGERAKKFDWPRDISAKIRAKADEKLTKDSLTAKANKPTLLTLTSERELIEANANVQVVIRQEHRATIKTARTVVDGLLSQLVHEGAMAEQIAEMRMVLQATPKDTDEYKAREARMAELWKGMMSFDGQVKGIKGLVDSLKSLIDLERQAYGIDARMDEPPKEPEAKQDDLIRRLAFLFAQAAATT